MGAEGGRGRPRRLPPLVGAVLARRQLLQEQQRKHQARIEVHGLLRAGVGGSLQRVVGSPLPIVTLVRGWALAEVRARLLRGEGRAV